ncbi:MAG: aromatic ring-hydroxylating dioxygenase subunit alpha [Bdellovibrionota bacterium]
MTTDVLSNVWYVLALSEEVSKKKPISKVLLGQPVVLYRDQSGKAVALRDLCPHRGIPLSYGRIVEDEVECPYHGWRFDKEGTCTVIPALCEGQNLDCRKIKIRRYLTHEQAGLVWVYTGDDRKENPATIPFPELTGLRNLKRRVTMVEHFPCHIDHAVIGLMDPAHGPYVHKSFLWRSEKTMIQKKKKFAPVDFGFQMVKHPPSANSKAYKIFGGAPTTEITFQLPSTRVEHIQAGKNNFFSFTALTPVDEKNTLIFQIVYWDIGWLGLIKPFIKWFARYFLFQDINVVAKQQDGLKYDPTLMLINDSDTQAKWYYALKSEWFKSAQENRTFVNPVKETELRWRS